MEWNLSLSLYESSSHFWQKGSERNLWMPSQFPVLHCVDLQRFSQDAAVLLEKHCSLICKRWNCWCKNKPLLEVPNSVLLRALETKLQIGRGPGQISLWKHIKFVRASCTVHLTWDLVLWLISTPVFVICSAAAFSLIQLSTPHSHHYRSIFKIQGFDLRDFLHTMMGV